LAGKDLNNVNNWKYNAFLRDDWCYLL
jgi:hypothetical protein